MQIDNIKEYIKSNPKFLIYVIIILICLFSLLMINSNDNENEPEYQDTVELSSDKYKSELENNLKTILSKIEGVGEAEVMITLESEYTYEYVKDSTDVNEKTVILSNKEAIVKTIVYPKVSGVLIVCKGGKKPKVIEQITEAISTLLDIPTNKVCVSPL